MERFPFRVPRTLKSNEVQVDTDSDLLVGGCSPSRGGMRVGGMNVSLLLPTFILPFGLLGRVDNGHQHLTGSWRFGTLGRRLQGLRLQLVYGI